MWWTPGARSAFWHYPLASSESRCARSRRRCCGFVPWPWGHEGMGKVPLSQPGDERGKAELGRAECGEQEEGAGVMGASHWEGIWDLAGIGQRMSLSQAAGQEVARWDPNTCYLTASTKPFQLLVFITY